MLFAFRFFSSGFGFVNHCVKMNFVMRLKRTTTGPTNLSLVCHMIRFAFSSFYKDSRNILTSFIIQVADFQLIFFFLIEFRF